MDARVDTASIFFSLLRAGLYGEAVPPEELPESIDWRAVSALSRKHSVSGIIIEGAAQLPEDLRPSEAEAASMCKFAARLIAANARLDMACGRLSAFLESEGVNGVLLKGQGVARYYRTPQMRHCGDIDYYVGKGAYKKALEVCLRELADEPESTEETDQHAGFEMGGVSVELHRLATRMYSPFRARRFQKWMEEMLERSPRRRTLDLGGASVTLPPVSFDAVFIFYHAWRHCVTGGIGLRQLCDWAMLFRTSGAELDREETEANVRAFGLEKGWKLFACIAVRHLGVRPEAMPLYDAAWQGRAEKILGDILDGGNFGYYSKDSATMPASRSSLRYAMHKMRYATKDFVALFRLSPLEATSLYLSRLGQGAAHVFKRAARRSQPK